MTLALFCTSFIAFFFIVFLILFLFLSWFRFCFVDVLLLILGSGEKLSFYKFGTFERFIQERNEEPQNGDSFLTMTRSLHSFRLGTKNRPNVFFDLSHLSLFFSFFFCLFCFQFEFVDKKQRRKTCWWLNSFCVCFWWNVCCDDREFIHYFGMVEFLFLLVNIFMIPTKVSDRFLFPKKNNKWHFDNNSSITHLIHNLTIPLSFEILLFLVCQQIELIVLIVILMFC